MLFYFASTSFYGTLIYSTYTALHWMETYLYIQIHTWMEAVVPPLSLYCNVFLKPFISFICSQEIKKDQCNVFCFCFLVNNAPSRSSSVLWNSIRLCWCQKTTLLYLAPKLTMTFCCHLHFKATPVAQSQPHPTELSTSRYLFCIMSLALYLSFAFIVPLFFSCIIQH